MSANIVYKNTSIDWADNDTARTWFSHEYPQSFIDNYMPSKDNYFYNTYEKSIVDNNTEYHYFGINGVMYLTFIIRKYQN